MTKLNELCKKRESQQSSPASDDAALQRYMESNPVNMNPTGGMDYPCWDLSDAQRPSRKILQRNGTWRCNLESYACDPIGVPTLFRKTYSGNTSIRRSGVSLKLPIGW